MSVTDLDSRERLSAKAVRGAVKLAEFWRLQTAEQIDLLGLLIVTIGANGPRSTNGQKE